MAWRLTCHNCRQLGCRCARWGEFPNRHAHAQARGKGSARLFGGRRQRRAALPTTKAPPLGSSQNVGCRATVPWNQDDRSGEEPWGPNRLPPSAAGHTGHSATSAHRIAICTMWRQRYNRPRPAKAHTSRWAAPALHAELSPLHVRRRYATVRQHDALSPRGSWPPTIGATTTTRGREHMAPGPVQTSVGDSGAVNAPVPSCRWQRRCACATQPDTRRR